MATSDQHTATAETFLASISPDTRKHLRALIQTDRPAFAEALKANGCAKMGVRLKVELLLQQQTADAGEGAASASDANAAPTDVSDPPAAATPPTTDSDQPAPYFIETASFAGAKTGYVFKLGSKGVGYYKDDPSTRYKDKSDPAEMKQRRGFTGNLSWLSAEPDQVEPEAAAEEAAAPIATAPAAKPMSSALIVPGTPAEPIECKDGKLSARRRAVLEKQSGPFAPDLREGKYADVGFVLRINHKKWGLCEKCELHTFYCRDLDTGLVSAHGFQELETTDLSLKKFMEAKAKWDARAPLAARTLRDDRKGQVHKSWTGAPINSLRLTNKPAPGKGYYAGVVPSVPVLMPPRIDPTDVNAVAEGGEGAADGVTTPASGDGAKTPMGQNLDGEYYYAHRRKIDFKIPTPTPQRID